MTTDRAPYGGWFGRYARKRCPHSNLEGIYGDPINHNGGWRLWCRDCRRYLNGPVSLSKSRQGEVSA